MGDRQPAFLSANRQPRERGRLKALAERFTAAHDARMAWVFAGSGAAMGAHVLIESSTFIAERANRELRFLLLFRHPPTGAGCRRRLTYFVMNPSSPVA